MAIMSESALEIESGKGLTLESIWALFRETDKKIQETDALITRNARIEAERQAEAKAEMAELRKTVDKMCKRVDTTSKTVDATSKKVDKMCKRVDAVSRNIDGVNHTLGNWTEEMVRTRLWEKFAKIGYTFTKGGRQTFKNKKKQFITEVDAFLENGEYAMAVEIKSQFTIKDVDALMEQLKLLRNYMNAHKDSRKLLGGAAGAVIREDVRRYAHENGLYVVVQSGDSVALAKAPKGFKPKEW